MRYPELRYVLESEDPSLSFETRDLVVKVIDNSGLRLKADSSRESYFGKYGTNSPLPFSHHLGYHGIRTLYSKAERRNLVIPYGSWLNLQTVQFSGIQNDPVDERAWSGVGRGWPIELERAGKGARLTLDPLPQTQFKYSLELHPAEPDGVDFAVSFVFHRRAVQGPSRLRATWPCYVNSYTDVRFFYPRGESVDEWQWDALAEPLTSVLGDPVGYRHEQMVYSVAEQALPLGYGLIGDRALVMMFDDSHIRFFVVNAGGHMPYSTVQNPAWDFEWVVEDYPLNEPVGFRGRLAYMPFSGPDEILARYHAWVEDL